MIQKRTARELLLTAVTELLETQDIEQISVKDIAAHCGVSTRTFYNCFIDSRMRITSRQGNTWTPTCAHGTTFAANTIFSFMAVNFSMESLSNALQKNC